MIRWEQDEENRWYWYGYVGKVKMFELNSNLRATYITFVFDEYAYSSLKAAKRGAERMFKRFLKEAGLEVS